MEGAHRVGGSAAVDTVHRGFAQQADFREHLLYAANGRGRGIRVDGDLGILIGQIVDLRRLGGRLRGRAGGFDVRDAVVVLAVLQEGAGQRVGIAVDGQRLLVPLLVDPLLERGDGAGRGLSVHAVIGARGQQTQSDQLALHSANGVLGGLAVHDVAAGVGHGFRRRRGRRGRGRGGGLRGRGLELLPLLHVVIEEGQTQRVHGAAGLQHLVALQLVDASLEAAHGGAGGVVKPAAVGARGQHAQHRQLALHLADLVRAGVFVDHRLVRRCGDLRRGRRCGLRRGRGPRHIGLVEPLLGLRPGDAVHGQLGLGIVGLVDVGLQVLHGLAGRRIVLSGDLRVIQPTQRHQFLLERPHVRLAGLGRHRGIPGGVAGQRGHGGGLLRNRGAGIALYGLCARTGVVLVGIVHPRQIGVHQRGKGRRGVGRRRGRLRGNPHLVGVQRGVLRHVLAAVERAIEKQYESRGRGDDHQRGDDGDDGDAPAAVRLGALLPRGRLRRGGFALRDIGGAVLLEEEVALAGILLPLHAGAQLFQPGVKAILQPGDGHHGAVVQPLRAVPRQILANAQLLFALGVERRVDDAGGVLTQRAADQKAVVVDQRSGQHLDLRHRGVGIPAAVRAGAVPAQVFKAVHAQVFVCH